MGIKQFVFSLLGCFFRAVVTLLTQQGKLFQMKHIIYPLILSLVTLFWSKLRDYKSQNETQSS